MHYLEDYLESKAYKMVAYVSLSFLTFSVIEYLPAELKARFHQIRELDGHVQSKLLRYFLFLSLILMLTGQLDSLNDRSKTFFALCRKNNKPELREQQYQNLCRVVIFGNQGAML